LCELACRTGSIAQPGKNPTPRRIPERIQSSLSVDHRCDPLRCADQPRCAKCKYKLTEVNTYIKRKAREYFPGPEPTTANRCGWSSHAVAGTACGCVFGNGRNVMIIRNAPIPMPQAPI